MGLPTAVIDALVASGCSVEQLAAAMKAANSEVDAHKAAKREADAIRKRRQRDKEAVIMSRDVTRTERDGGGQSVTSRDIPPPDKEVPQTPKEINPLPTQENTLRVQKKASRLPDDFEPDLGWAAAQGLTRQQAELEAAKFGDYWRGKGPNATKLDWPATWRNWIRSAAERLPQARGSPPGQVKAPSQAEIFKRIGERAANGQDTADRGSLRPALSHLPAIRPG